MKKIKNQKESAVEKLTFEKLTVYELNNKILIRGGLTTDDGTLTPPTGTSMNCDN